MLEFQEKRKLKRMLYCKTTFFFLFIVIVLFFSAVWGVYKKQDLTKNNLNITASSLEGLRTREKMLSAEIERLKTESGREEEIREKYGLVKPGEEVIIVIEQASDTKNIMVSDSDSFWQKVKNWLR
jgi:cell division protein FtsB